MASTGSPTVVFFHRDEDQGLGVESSKIFRHIQSHTSLQALWWEVNEIIDSETVSADAVRLFLANSTLLYHNQTLIFLSRSTY